MLSFLGTMEKVPSQHGKIAKFSSLSVMAIEGKMVIKEGHQLAKFDLDFASFG